MMYCCPYCGMRANMPTLHFGGCPALKQRGEAANKMPSMEGIAPIRGRGRGHLRLIKGGKAA